MLGNPLKKQRRFKSRCSDVLERGRVGIRGGGFTIHTPQSQICNRDPNEADEDCEEAEDQRE